MSGFVLSPRARGLLAAWFPLALLGLALAIFLPDLNHPAIQRADEECHQPATRGVYDTGIPMIYENPIVPALPGEDPYSVYWDSGVFLHKPPLPFWLGALLMLLVGVKPLALRLVSVALAYATGLGLYQMARRVLGGLLAAGLSIAFLFLPFGFAMVQGYQWGDVTDVTLLGFVTLSIWMLWVALERDSPRIAALAGAFCGCGYLCKSALALVPIGVAGSLAFLGWRRLAPRVRLALVFSFLGAVLLVAVPWNLYSAIRWPGPYWFEAKYTLGFLGNTTRLWARRGLDGVLNDVDALEFVPWPTALFPLAGLWLLWRAWKLRTTPLWILSLWLWGEWVPLSIAVVKVPSHAWAAATPALIAVGLMLNDSFERPWLAAAALGTLATEVAVQVMRPSSWLHLLPPYVPMANWARLPHQGIAAGLVAAALAGGLGHVAQRRVPNLRALRVVGWAAVLLAGWFGFVQSARGIHVSWKEYGDDAVDSYADVEGPALDQRLPKNAVLFLTSRDPKCCFGRQSMMFYSGRMTYPASAELVDIARQKGFHPYLVSGVAQPYHRVEGVPANAWLQAYDLDAPLVTPSPLPPDLRRIDVPVAGGLQILGVAVNRGDSTRDRYVFYLSANRLRPMEVTFIADDGSVDREPLPPIRQLDWTPVRPRYPRPEVWDSLFEIPGVERSSVTYADQLSPWITDPASSSWFTVSVPGPLRSRLRSVEFMGSDLPLP